jgi:hypothetical protein
MHVGNRAGGVSVDEPDVVHINVQAGKRIRAEIEILRELKHELPSGSGSVIRSSGKRHRPTAVVRLQLVELPPNPWIWLFIQAVVPRREDIIPAQTYWAMSPVAAASRTSVDASSDSVTWKSALQNSAAAEGDLQGLLAVTHEQIVVTGLRVLGQGPRRRDPGSRPAPPVIRLTASMLSSKDSRTVTS